MSKVLVVLLWAAGNLPVSAQTAEPLQPAVIDAPPVVRTADLASEDSRKAIPVVFPASFNAPKVVVPAPVAPMPVPSMAKPKTNLQLESQKLMISQMNGEVHFKHLQDSRIAPSRALFIETGKGASWCETKMLDCTGRVSGDSQISVFPDTGVYYVQKGALMVKVNRNSEAKYTVIAGDFVCRVQGTMLRVVRNQRAVNFQVLEGTVTVYNRQTGEVFTASQVTQPIK